MSRCLLFAVWTVAALVCAPAGSWAEEPGVHVPNCRVSVMQRAAVAGEKLGVLTEVLFREGEMVRKGDLVARLRDEAARQSLLIARKEAANEIDLRFAEKASELATLEYSKAAELNRDVPGGHSELEIRKLRLAAERAVLQIQQATFRLELADLRRREAEVALESFRITAPFDGVVLRVHKQLGEAVHPGDPLIEIGNFSVMRVEGFVSVPESLLLRKGNPVTVAVTGLDAKAEGQRPYFTGRVTFVDPVVNEVSQQVRVWAEVENREDLLRDGLTAVMRIDPSTRNTSRPAARTATAPE